MEWSCVFIVFSSRMFREGVRRGRGSVWEQVWSSWHEREEWRVGVLGLQEQMSLGRPPDPRAAPPSWCSSTARVGTTRASGFCVASSSSSTRHKCLTSWMAGQCWGEWQWAWLGWLQHQHLCGWLLCLFIYVGGISYIWFELILFLSNIWVQFFQGNMGTVSDNWFWFEPSHKSTSCILY